MLFKSIAQQANLIYDFPLFAAKNVKNAIIHYQLENINQVKLYKCAQALTNLL